VKFDVHAGVHPGCAELLNNPSHDLGGHERRVSFGVYTTTRDSTARWVACLRGQFFD
jgi:hypothetical protein